MLYGLGHKFKYVNLVENMNGHDYVQDIKLQDINLNNKSTNFHALLLVEGPYFTLSAASLSFSPSKLCLTKA